jgi:hypothetical protein
MTNGYQRRTQKGFGRHVKTVPGRTGKTQRNVVLSNRPNTSAEIMVRFFVISMLDKRCIKMFNYAKKHLFFIIKTKNFRIIPFCSEMFQNTLSAEK